MNMQTQNLTPAGAAQDQTPVKPKGRTYDRYMRIGTFGVFAMIVMLLLAMFAPIQGAVLAPGTIVVQGKSKVVQHLDGGIVGEILVQDGDRVTEGDILMRLDPTSLSANRDLLSNRLLEAKALQARLIAERDGAGRIDWKTPFTAEDRAGSASKLIKDQGELFRTRRRGIEGQIEQLRSYLISPSSLSLRPIKPAASTSRRRSPAPCITFRLPRLAVLSRRLIRLWRLSRRIRL